MRVFLGRDTISHGGSTRTRSVVDRLVAGANFDGDVGRNRIGGCKNCPDASSVSVPTVKVILWS